MAPTSRPTAVSAPGKVLLAGGYLVLDRAYTGVVFGLSARINVIAQEIRTSPGVHLTEIVVHSPQFMEAYWRYGYHLVQQDGGIKVTQLQAGSPVAKNHFIETTLNFALTYINRVANPRPNHAIKPSRLTILADNDYYSQPPTSTPPATPVIPQDNDTSHAARFARFGIPIRAAHKTGLGSSAALVTALTAALLTRYLDPSEFDLDSADGRKVLHNLAQTAHCAAQGKVGSGFDVAAAVYGSSCYRRFSPTVLSTLPDVGKPGFGLALECIVSDAHPNAAPIWDTEIVKDAVRLPPGVAMRMCDVDCGSQTVSMVKQVLAWRERETAAAQELWDELQQRNEALAAVLRDGRTDEIRAAVRAVRELVKMMGVESGVPIEPDTQTKLLDALEDVEGVYGGVVPGAGGFDAVALLVKDDEETATRIKEFTERWSRQTGRRVSLLGVKGEMEGVRKEALGLYDGWLE